MRKQWEVQAEYIPEGHLQNENHRVFTKQEEGFNRKCDHNSGDQEAYDPNIFTAAITRATTLTMPDGAQLRSPGPQQLSKPVIPTQVSHTDSQGNSTEHSAWSLPLNLLI